MISKIFLLSAIVAAAQATFCPPFEIPKIGCSDKCSKMGEKCNLGEIRIFCGCWPTKCRNSLGNCIPKQKSCTRQNEIYATSGADKKCDSLGQQMKPERREGCYCVVGFVRDKLGNCVPISKCYPKCKQNEEFKKYGCNKKCVVGSVQDCRPRAVAGCYCKEGFIQSEDDKCIERSECECSD